MKPVEYAVADTPELCGALGLSWKPGGYGVLLCEDAAGLHWTLVTDDVEYHQLLVTASRAGVAGGLQVDSTKYPMKRPGWPDEWSAG